MKLNMVEGKAELLLRGGGADAGQEEIHSQLRDLKDAWASLLVSTMSCHR